MIAYSLQVLKRRPRCSPKIKSKRVHSQRSPGARQNRSRATKIRVIAHPNLQKTTAGARDLQTQLPKYKKHTSRPSKIKINPKIGWKSSFLPSLRKSTNNITGSSRKMRTSKSTSKKILYRRWKKLRGWPKNS